MLRRQSLAIWIFLVLIFSGCTTVQNIKLVDPFLREIPEPNYTLGVIGTQLTATFYYTAYSELKDIDGSVIAEPEYMDFFQVNYVDIGEVRVLTLTIEIKNPERYVYSLKEETLVSNKSYDARQSGGKLNQSDLEYRQFVYRLPLEEDIGKVDYCVTLSIGDNEAIRIGPFRYQILNTKGGDIE